MIRPERRKQDTGALAFYSRPLAGVAAREEGKQTGWGDSSPTRQPGPRGHLVGRGLGSIETGKLSFKRHVGESPATQ